MFCVEDLSFPSSSPPSPPPLRVHRSSPGGSDTSSGSIAIWRWQRKGAGHRSIGYSSDSRSRCLEAELWRHAWWGFPDLAGQI
jgi:hypothetical protein